MTLPELAPRRRYGGIVATWAFALVAALAIAVFVPFEWRFRWFGVAGGLSVIFGFVAHLIDGRTSGYIFRVGVAALGALALIGVVALVAVLVAVSPV
ncbi:hypothetical protein [Microbacterium sp. NPDC096154]|uniref:hypothetical protein n=1 Tax=Microbacterium sp. NPDC096154 TaxID=3155549 RepID=UPI00332B3E05